MFTLAAGNIAPRLLDRFSDDRTNQIAVGLLGALFLHSLLSLAAQDGRPVFLTVAAAVVLAMLAVIMLLLFVDKVALRVTIDEEISAIAKGLDASFQAIARKRDAVGKISEPDWRVDEAHMLTAPVSG